MRHIDDDIGNLQFHTIRKHKNMFHKDQDCVVLTDDEYDGVIIQYDVVQAYEEKNEAGDNIGKFSFNFNICENSDNLDLTTNAFKNRLGDILQHLIKDHLERAE